MPSITIRNLPINLIRRIKQTASQHALSMEQEVRTLLQVRYIQKQDLLERIRSRWDTFAAPSAGNVISWIEEGRK